MKRRVDLIVRKVPLLTFALSSRKAICLTSSTQEIRCHGEGHEAECFPTAKCQYLEADLTSDHKPLLTFFDNGAKRRRGLFRYDRRLCKNEEAKKVIAEAWNGTANASVSGKLSFTRSAISAWDRTQDRNSQDLIDQRKRDLDAVLASLLNDIALIQDISAKLNAAYLAEEEFWKQRSRLLWLKLRDRNT